LGIHDGGRPSPSHPRTFHGRGCGKGVAITPLAWSSCAIKPTIRSYRGPLGHIGGRARVPALVIMADWPPRHGTPGPETRSRRPVCRGWPNDDKRMSWLAQRRQTRPGGARPGRRIWPRSHSSPGPRAGRLDDHGIPAGGTAQGRDHQPTRSTRERRHIWTGAVQEGQQIHIHGISAGCRRPAAAMNVGLVFKEQHQTHIHGPLRDAGGRVVAQRRPLKGGQWCISASP
jgi:hypothetical protein